MKLIYIRVLKYGQNINSMIKAYEKDIKELKKAHKPDAARRRTIKYWQEIVNDIKPYVIENEKSKSDRA